MFQVWFITMKAWFDKVWFDANFYVHIKSEGHHGVYKPHDEKAGLHVEKSVYSLVAWTIRVNRYVLGYCCYSSQTQGNETKHKERFMWNEITWSCLCKMMFMKKYCEKDFIKPH